MHRAAAAKPDSRSIGAVHQAAEKCLLDDGDDEADQGAFEDRPRKHAPRRNPGATSRMPSACIAIDIGSMVATPIRGRPPNCRRNAGAARRNPSLAPAQPEPPHREQEGEQQDELPEPADDPVEGPVRLERVDPVPGRPGEQRREQQRAEDDAEERERRAHQRSCAMAANARRAASIVAVDLRVAMSGADEARLEGRGREVDAGLEHGVEEAPEAGRVARHDAAVVGHRAVRGEEEAEHAADAVGRERDARLARGALEAVDEAVRRLRERAWKPGRETPSSVASPAAIASGLPHSVPAW